MPRLRRSDWTRPGIHRRRRGKGFSYVWPDGTSVRDRRQLERIRALAIPPAWDDVWICPWSNGHIQAVGADDAGRRQYRYHDTWSEARSSAKFDRVLLFGAQLPRLRAHVTADLRRRQLDQRRVAASAVRLLDRASFRIGGEAYAEDNESYGLSTLLARHVRSHGRTVDFHFTAKSGVEHAISVTDSAVARTVATLTRRRGGPDEVLAYRSGRRWLHLRAEDINAYIKEAIGDDFSAKDFRTWNATVLAVGALAETGPPPTSESARRRAVVHALTTVAHHLGNTVAVCRSAYVDPRVIDHYRRGDLPPRLAHQGRERLERDVLKLLHQRSAAAA